MLTDPPRETDAYYPGKLFIPTVGEAFETIVRPIALAFDPTTNVGGWFTCWMRDGNYYYAMRPEYGCQVGYVVGLDADERPKILEFMETANDMALRIWKNAHASSWPTRDPDNGKRGGGIRINGGQTIIAFAGLAEWANEMLMLVVAHEWRQIDVSEIAAVIALSENTQARDYFTRKCGLKL